MPPEYSGHTDPPDHQLKTTKVVEQQGLDDEDLGEEGDVQEPVPPLAVHVWGVETVLEDDFGAQQPAHVRPEEAFIGGMGV